MERVVSITTQVHQKHTNPFPVLYHWVKVEIKSMNSTRSKSDEFQASWFPNNKNEPNLFVAIFPQQQNNAFKMGWRNGMQC